MTTGRNFDEVLPVIDSFQLTAKHRVATPVNWKQGDNVIIAGSVSNDEAKEIYGSWEEPKPYIRIVPQPSCRVALVAASDGDRWEAALRCLRRRRCPRPSCTSTSRARSSRS